MQRAALPIVLFILCLFACCCHPCWGIGSPPNTRIQILATADYINIYNQPESADPASVTLTVLQVAGTRITWQPPSDTVTQGADFYIPIRITNTGNGADTLDLSATSSHGWTVSLVYDDNADGIHQADEIWEISNTALAADGYCQCFVKLHIPADATTGDTVIPRAASRFSPTSGTTSVGIDVPEPGMTATQIALTASPATPTIGQTINIDGAIVPVVSDPISVTITGPDSATSVTSCTPGPDGRFTTTCATDHTGIYTVQADYPGDDHHAASTSRISIDVAAKNTTAIDMQAVPSNPVVGSDVIVSGTLIPAMPATISITYQPPAGQSIQADVTTDQFGRFSHTIRMSTAGQWTVTGAYAGDATNAACNCDLTMQVDADGSQQTQHTIQFTTAASASPAVITSPESAQCACEASDSLGHTVRYQWSDGGAGGTFTPTATVASPAYLAPPNRGSANAAIILTCTATCSEDTDVAAVSTTTLTVKPVDTKAPSVLSVSPQSDSVLNELTAAIVVKFSKPMNQSTTHQATSFSPTIAGAVCAWDDTGSIMTITHQPLAAGGTYECTISTAAQDSGGTPMQSQYHWSFSAVPLIRFDPSDIGAAPSSTFATPRVIVSDPTQPGNVSFKLTIPANLVINDALDGNGSLACVRKGADAGDFHCDWDSGRREITVTAGVPTPSTSVELVKSIHIGAPASAGKYEVKVQDNTALTIQVRALVPGDFNGDGLVTITDAVRFTQEYVRWQADPEPTFDADTDDIYDLAPHTQVAWPNWVKIGDHVIDALDAAAFEECWTQAHSSATQSMARASYSPTLRCAYAASAPTSGRIVVSVAQPVNGLFEVSVPIPEGFTFDPATGPSGSLCNVSTGPGSGSVFFSEYDHATRTVRMAGTVKGAAPYVVATIALSK